MYTIKNLILIGTSHISPESVKEVNKSIEENNPDIIALELDLERFKRLISNKKHKISIKDIGKSGFLINLVGAYLERYLGKKVGTSPGVEMKEAINLARKNNIKIALIDQDIRITLKKLKSRFTFKEKLNIVKNIFKGIFSTNKMVFDLKRVPEQKLIKKLTLEIKQEYPSIYKTLIEERDEIMADALFKLMVNNKKIIAVIGDRHIQGITKRIKWNLQKKKQ